MAADKISKVEMNALIVMLERRLAVIADAELRESDPSKQLAQLQEVSEQIMAFHEEHSENLSPRLNHFLGNCSFDKALEWARSAF
ncbi:MAG: hypothetical protein P1U58_06850 [Verrucomicrobiales bacterium]|nr:hypothetical protein [Verrucomicrobiales bacterium]